MLRIAAAIRLAIAGADTRRAAHQQLQAIGLPSARLSVQQGC
jgi:hypothetical protein